MRTSSTFGCNKIYAYPPPPAPVSFPANECSRAIEQMISSFECDTSNALSNA